VCAALAAAPVLAQGNEIEVREGYEVISAKAFSELPADTPEGRKYTLHHVRFLKLFEGDLKVFGGFHEGRQVRSRLHGKLIVDLGKSSRKALVRNLNSNKDSDGKTLKTKRSNVQVFGVGVRTPRGYALSVNRVHLVDDFQPHFEELAGALPEGDAQARIDLVREIRAAVRFFPADQKALAPLLEKLRSEAQEFERANLPPLPEGAEAHVRFARRHDEISILATLWEHPEVEESLKAKAAKVLRDELNARLYLGKWYALDDLRGRLGFAQDESGTWLTHHRLDLLTSAREEKKRRKNLMIKPSVGRQLLEVAMKKGDVIAGMDKAMVIAAKGGFPVEVDRVRERIRDAKLTWELWVMPDGLKVYLLNGFVFMKEEPQ
jgi:hypothetical protein